MKCNKIKFIMPPKYIVMNDLNDIGTNNRLYYSRNLLARSVFRQRMKYALTAINPMDKIVLDIGAGAGFLAYNLSINGAKVIACDLKTKFKKCNQIYNNLLMNSRIEFNNADIFHLPFKSNFFDVIYALDMLEHLDDVELALIEIKRVLKDDGFLIVSIPNENIFYRIARKITGVKKANHAHDSTELMQLISNFFSKNSGISVTPFKLFHINSYINGGIES